MPLTIQKATPDDAPLLVRVIDMARGGVVPTIWAEMAPPGMDGSGAGLALIAAEDGDFSYPNGFIAERDVAEMGGLTGYALPTTPQPAGPDVPEVFIIIDELAQLVPKGRRQGVGAALLNQAED